MVRWRSVWAGGKIKSDFRWHENPSTKEKTIELIWKIHAVTARSISTVRGCRLKCNFIILIFDVSIFEMNYCWHQSSPPTLPLILKIGSQRPKFSRFELHFGFASDYSSNLGRAAHDWLSHRIWGLEDVSHQLLAYAVPNDFMFPINERWFLIEWKYLLERLSLRAGGREGSLMELN